MPKTTFFNLAKEKQELLMNAAKKEFSRVPFHEASISNMIKDAGIPRGSFYQYFDDKEDVFLFLLDEYSKWNYELFKSIIKKNDGNLFESFLEWFKTNLKKFEQPENCQFFKNTFLNMNYKIEKIVTQNIYEERIRSRFFEIMELINSDDVNIKSERELYHVIKILMAVTFQNLIQSFAKELPFEQAVATYSFEIDLLKKGFSGVNELS